MPADSVPPLTAPASKPLTARELLFKGHGIVGRLFAWEPWKAASATSLLALLCLNIPAGLLGLGHIIDANHNDVGYYVKYHWSIVYPVLAPVLIALAILGFRRMHVSVYQLIEKSEERSPVIKDEIDQPATDYPGYLSEELSKTARYIELVALVGALLITAWDTKDLWPGFFNGGDFEKSRVFEWDTAFRPGGAHVHGGIVANFAFDLVAYTFQTALTFLGLFFTMKYWSFLRVMIQIIDRNRPPYKFAPLIRDIRRRLGLTPLGGVFNLFLSVVVLFQLYGLYHRIELIDLYNHARPGTYIKTVWEKAHHKPEASAQANPKTEGLQDQALALLLKIPLSDYAWTQLANPSSWLPLLISVPPILVISLLPLGRLFMYLRKEINLLTNKTNVKLSELEDEMKINLPQPATDQDRAKAAEKNDALEKQVAAMKERLKCLSETTIWPNGSTLGSIFLILMTALLIATACPPLLIWGLASGVIVKLVWSLLGKQLKLAKSGD